MSELMTILTLSGIVYSIINYLKTPILKARPEWSEYLIYLQFAAAAIVVFASGANVLLDVTRNDMLGRILTALLSGGGSELIYSIQKRLIMPNQPAVIELGELVEVEDANLISAEPIAFSGAYRPTTLH
jgi:hypothetical protein